MKMDYTHYDQDKQINKTVMNPYIDMNYEDRSREVEAAFTPTLKDIKNDPEFYAELVNDLMWHWVHNTRETELMVMAKRNMLIGQGVRSKVQLVEKALSELIEKGAQIEQIEADKFMVYDNGFWGFCSDEDTFIVDGDEILEMHEQYVK